MSSSPGFSAGFSKPAQQMLATILQSVDPPKVDKIRGVILQAVEDTYGTNRDAAEVLRLLEDIRIAQGMSGIDMDYAEHYTHMHQAGVDFMQLVQVIKAANKTRRALGAGLFKTVGKVLFPKN